MLEYFSDIYSIYSLRVSKIRVPEHINHLSIFLKNHQIKYFRYPCFKTLSEHITGNLYYFLRMSNETDLRVLKKS